MPNHLFFLSYSSRCGKHLVKRFFDDLTMVLKSKISSEMDLDQDQLGYLDVERNELGVEWKETIKHALQNSKTLICLYSRAYFESEYCGKELMAFGSRINAHLADSPSNSESPPIILPIVWDPFEMSVPSNFEEIQFKKENFGEIYSQDGLSMLLRLSKNDEYQIFLNEFSQILIRAAENFPLKDSYKIPSLDKINSAFTPSQKKNKLKKIEEGKQKGPGFVKCLFVAGKKEEMKPVRENTMYYGTHDARVDWRPYLEVFTKALTEFEFAAATRTETIGFISQKVIITEDLVIEEIYPWNEENNLIEKLRVAENNNNIVIIIVDPWSLKLSFFKDFLQRFDECSFINCGVLVVWNEKDQETIEEGNKKELRNQMQAVFKRNLRLKNSYFQSLISSKRMLEKTLQTTLREVLRQIIGEGEPDSQIGRANPLPTNSVTQEQE